MSFTNLMKSKSPSKIIYQFADNMSSTIKKIQGSDIKNMSSMISPKNSSVYKSMNINSSMKNSFRNTIETIKNKPKSK